MSEISKMESKTYTIDAGHVDSLIYMVVYADGKTIITKDDVPGLRDGRILYLGDITKNGCEETALETLITLCRKEKYDDDEPLLIDEACKAYSDAVSFVRDHMKTEIHNQFVRDLLSIKSQMSPRLDPNFRNEAVAAFHSPSIFAEPNETEKQDGDERVPCRVCIGEGYFPTKFYMTYDNYGDVTISTENPMQGLPGLNVHTVTINIGDRLGSVIIFEVLLAIYGEYANDATVAGKLRDQIAYHYNDSISVAYNIIPTDTLYYNTERLHEALSKLKLDNIKTEHTEATNKPKQSKDLQTEIFEDSESFMNISLADLVEMSTSIRLKAIVLTNHGPEKILIDKQRGVINKEDE